MSSVSDANYRAWVSSDSTSTYKQWAASQGSSVSGSSSTEKENSDLSVNDFLNLMVTQLKNQDFMNPVDDTQYVSQLAQFSTLQQMQELAEYSKSNYAISLVGKNVTAAQVSASGNITKITGIIDKVSLLDNDYQFYIGNKSFKLPEIMVINNIKEADDTDKEVDDTDKKTDDTDKEVDDTDKDAKS